MTDTPSSELPTMPPESSQSQNQTAENQRDQQQANQIQGPEQYTLSDGTVLRVGCISWNGYKRFHSEFIPAISDGLQKFIADKWSEETPTNVDIDELLQDISVSVDAEDTDAAIDAVENALDNAGTEQQTQPPTSARIGEIVLECLSLIDSLILQFTERFVLDCLQDDGATHADKFQPIDWLEMREIAARQSNLDRLVKKSGNGLVSLVQMILKNLGLDTSAFQIGGHFQKLKSSVDSAGQ